MAKIDFKLQPRTKHETERNNRPFNKLLGQESIVIPRGSQRTVVLQYSGRVTGIRVPPPGLFLPRTDESTEAKGLDTFNSYTYATYFTNRWISEGGGGIEMRF